MIPEHTKRLTERLVAWLSRRLPDSGSQAIDELSASLSTATGPSRSENQDCVVAARFSDGGKSKAFAVFLLCDGIGGLRDGGVCARLASATFLSHLTENRWISGTERILQAARAANDAIHSLYRENGGTTFSCLFREEGSTPMFVNLGDSRIYRRRKDELVQITVDDTIESQVKNLSGGRQVIASRSFGRQLTQYIGMGPDVQFCCKPLEERQNESSAFLLTSDGVHSINPETLTDTTVCAPTSLDAVKRLTAIARWGKSNDNASAIYVGPGVASEETVMSERFSVWDSFACLDVVVERPQWPRYERVAYTREQKGRRGKPRQPLKERANESQNQPELSDASKNIESSQENGASEQSPAKDTLPPKEPLTLEIIEPDAKSAD